MDRESAEIIRDKALRAIRELHSIIVEMDFDWDSAELQPLKRGVGLSIGRIDTELLSVIYAEHPELDDLRSASNDQEQRT